MVAMWRLHPWRLLFALGLVAVAVAAFGCGGSDDGGGSAPSGETAGPLQVRLVADEVSGGMVFDPGEIRVRVGQTVHVMLDNKGVMLHDFSVINMPVRVAGTERHSGMTLHVESQTGQGGELEFVPLERGTYVFICSLPGHQQAGMEGKLIVS